MWLSEHACRKLLGPEKALLFFQEFGGSRLYIPVKPSKTHKIAWLIGFIGMAALCRVYGGDMIFIANAARQGAKKTRILDLIRQGLPLREIAKQTGVTERYVSQIKKTSAQSTAAAE